MKGKFAPPQIALHWLVFLLLVVTYATIELRGFAERGSLLRTVMIVTHFSCGVLVLVLMLARLFLRARHTSPTITPTPPRWQSALATLTHIVIYLLFIVLPVLGVASRYYRGRDWMLFGIDMPTSAVPNLELARTLIDWHEILAPLGYWLIGLHTVAALFHHYVMKDNTLLRMMPAKRG
ncbi:cytochrome b561 [Brenneria izbisi]|uniref:Cytochrome b561 n=1 Tax=Brenneria izbisi TaxID=2939450 RepID=A0AA41XUK6_9GAMM|nr:cytochrome b561 [Brenneria izbisi]MCV9878635.1 cytochrome b561 [Brenneria izbisi]MCV9882182.1 cytochrome b561 [Brenneria izbisi]